MCYLCKADGTAGSNYAAIQKLLAAAWRVWGPSRRPGRSEPQAYSPVAMNGVDAPPKPKAPARSYFLPGDDTVDVPLDSPRRCRGVAYLPLQYEYR